jgi:hypothetical protein
MLDTYDYDMNPEYARASARRIGRIYESGIACPRRSIRRVS